MLTSSWLLSFLLGFTFFSAAENRNFPQAFAQGVVALQKEEPTEARKAFLEALSADPQNAAARLNLGIAYAKEGDFGRAMAHFRIVLEQDPWSRAAREGLRFSHSKLAVKEIPHQIELMETLRRGILSYFGLRFCLALGALLTLGAGWMLLRWLGDSRRARRAQEAPPSLPISTTIMILMWVSALALIAAKWTTMKDPRATIVDTPVDVLSAPDEGTKLSEFHPGFEVIVRRERNDWLQVSYPGGPTGWIPARHAIRHSTVVPK